MGFKLYLVSQHQDCTMEYNVVFDTPMTVREFVEYVVNKDNIESFVYDGISVPEQIVTSAKLYIDISGSKRYEVLYELD